MSKQPQGEGFPLPDEFIKALDAIAVTDSQKQKEPEVENVDELTKSVFEIDNDDNDEVFKPKVSAANKTPKRSVTSLSNKTKEDVSNRVGGVNSRRRVGDMLKDASKKDKGSDVVHSEMPNADQLEGVEFAFPNDEKKGDLKNQLDTSMKRTESAAQEYNEGKLKSEDIEKVSSIDELLQVIDLSEGIQGSEEYFDKDKLKMIIKMVQDKQIIDGQEIGVEYVTRSGGLRQKVFDLLQRENTITPVPAERIKKMVPPLEDKEDVVTLGERPVISSRPKSKTENTPKPEDFVIPKTQKPAEFSIKSKAGVEFDEEETVPSYSPEQFQKSPVEDLEDPHVFRVPGEKKEYSLEELLDQSDLPEAPLSSDNIEIANTNEKPVISAKEDTFENSDVAKEYDDEIKLIKDQLKVERVKFLLAHEEVEEQSKKYKNPFKNWLLKVSEKRQEKLQQTRDKSEEARKSYDSTFRELVKTVALKDVDRIISLRANSPERKRYETVTPKDLEMFISQNEDLRESLEKYDAYQGVTLSTILNALKEKGKTKKEITDYRAKFIYGKVSKEINPAFVKEENDLMENLLKN